MGETPRLSPSIAQKLLDECPLSAWSAHRLLGNHKVKATDSQREGRLWHAALLEDGAGIEVLDFKDFRTKDAREARDRAEHDGKIPMVAHKWEAMQVGMKRIKNQLADFGVFLDGKVEERIEWDEFSTSGAPVPCSGYIDHRIETVIDDLKTGETCTTEHMASMLIARSHALLQDTAYRHAICAIHGYEMERTTMRFVFVQTREPYSVTPVYLSGEFQELSVLRWQRAVDTWAECLAKGTDRKHWPGPVEGCVAVHPPGWMLSQEIELEALK